MELTLSQKNILHKDRLYWMLVILILATMAFFLLLRDSRKQYGAVSFGAFPEFQALDSHGKIFDQHRLHGQLTVVIINNQIISSEIIGYLQKLSQGTARGKKFLRNLVITNQLHGFATNSLEFAVLSDEDYSKFSMWNAKNEEEGVILVDQNGIIRGIFDLQDKLQRIYFEGAVKGIL